jgi:hypothetical protein
VARIRSIKPDFWTSEQVMECSPMARLMFIGLWNFADDHGRLPCAPKTIKAQIFPADDINSEAVRRMIDELSSNGLVQVYVVDDKEYLFITGWRHQKIDRRQPAKYPDPPPYQSPTIRRMVSTDLRGSEGIGEDEDAASAAPFDEPEKPSEQTPEVELFRRGKELLGPSAGGLIKNLVKAKGGSIPLARAALETASTKQDCREYVGRIVKGSGDAPEDLRARGEAW